MSEHNLSRKSSSSRHSVKQVPPAAPAAEGSAAPNQKPPEKIEPEAPDYEEIEQRFMQVMRDLAVDKGMRRFRTEYERLYQALVKAHEGHRLLTERCRQLTEQAIENTGRIQTSVQLSQQDQIAVARLKVELDNTLRRLDLSCTIEDQARDVSRDLKQEIAHLEKIVDDGATHNTEFDNTLAELRRINDELIVQREEKNKEIDELNLKIVELESHGFEQLEDRLRHALEHVSALQSEIKMLNNQLLRETAVQDGLERRLSKTQNEIEQKINEAKGLQSTVKQQQMEIEQLKGVRHQQWVQLNAAMKTVAETKVNMAKMRADAAARKTAMYNAHNQLLEQKAEIKSQAIELAKVQDAKRQVERTHERLHHDVAIMAKHQQETDLKMTELKSEVKSISFDAEAAHHKMKEGALQIEAMQKTKDALMMKVSKTTKYNEEMTEQLRLQQVALDRLYSEIRRLKTDVTSRDDVINQLEKVRDRRLKEAGKAARYMSDLYEKVKLLDLEVYDYKKRQQETEAKIKHDKDLFETVRNERNQAGKSLLEAKDEIAELRKRLKLTEHQLDQVKEEIVMREALLLKERMDKAVIEKEKESLMNEVQKLKQQAADGVAVAENLNIEKQNLNKELSSYVAQTAQLLQQLTKVQTERDVIGSQLVRRNDELSLINEKVRVQQMALNKGDAQYNQRLEDIRVLKLEIRQLRHKNALLQKNCDILADMRLELLRLHKDLFRYRLRCQRLSDELTTPLNVHRWRQLESISPSLYEMSLKMTTIQKLLIAKTEDCIEKDLLLQQKDQACAALRAMAARRPGPEVSQQLSLSKRIIGCKSRQMKAMKAEMNLCIAQNEECKSEVDSLRSQLDKTKSLYFDLKRREQHRIQMRKLAESISLCPQLYGYRIPYVGGGFKMRPPQANFGGSST